MVIGEFDLIYKLDQKTTFLVFAIEQIMSKMKKYIIKIASKYIKILNRQKYILIA